MGGRQPKIRVINDRVIIRATGMANQKSRGAQRPASGANRLIILLLPARRFRVKHRWRRWTFFRSLNTDVNLIIVARMDEANESVLDFFLLPTNKFVGQRKVDLTETSCTYLEPYRVGNVDALVRSIFSSLPGQPCER